MARVSAIKYRETIWSELYAGNRHTVNCLRPAVISAENALELAPERRKRVVWRIDGGAGSDEQIRWLLSRDYQIVAKGTSNHRAHAWASQVRRWDNYRDVQIGEIPSPIAYGRPVRIFIKRRVKNGKFRHSYYIFTLALPAKGHFMDCYNRRGGAEVEQFRNDKSGLHLAARRKRSFPGQKGYLLLTDLAHNLLADFHHRALLGTRFEAFGLKRIVRDLLAIPGRLVFQDDNLVRIELLTLKQISTELIFCLERYSSGD